MKKAANLKSIIGMFKDKRNVSRNHDKYVFSEKPRRKLSKRFRLMKKMKEDKDLFENNPKGE
ncbi:MAG: hypothetical protein LHV68_08735 [Elusimicrobia bacterium]|nr:hypothetical protein [Candidatus Liberimonas magnetica]